MQIPSNKWVATILFSTILNPNVSYLQRLHSFKARGMGIIKTPEQIYIYLLEELDTIPAVDSKLV